MRTCKADGVWALIWERTRVKQESDRSTRRRRRASDDDDEGGDGRGILVVSARGWDVLDWLIRVWEEDEYESRKRNPEQRELHLSSPVRAQRIRPSILSHVPGAAPTSILVTSTVAG